MSKQSACETEQHTTYSPIVVQLTPVCRCLAYGTAALYVDGLQDALPGGTAMQQWFVRARIERGAAHYKGLSHMDLPFIDVTCSMCGHTSGCKGC